MMTRRSSTRPGGSGVVGVVRLRQRPRPSSRVAISTRPRRWIRSGQGLAAPGRGSMTLRDIADANGLDAPYATVICDKLVERAW